VSSESSLRLGAGAEPSQGDEALVRSDPAIEGRVDPDTYRVGPGDEFALRYSDLLDPKILRVGPSGEILLPDVGAVLLAGLTLREAQDKVRSALRPYVRGKGFVLALHRPRRFRLSVLGDVAHPGVVTLQAPVRASEAIEAAGGIAATGVRRGIQVRRGADTLRVDLVRYERSGDLKANPLVFETDVVFVPPVGDRVLVLGAVAHPGRYDYEPGDRLSGLLSLAGGILPQASPENLQLARSKQDGTKEVMPIRLGSTVDPPQGDADMALAPGDALLVPSNAHWREATTVWVYGEVARPGPYAIQDGVDRVRSILERAGGFTPYADRAAVRVERELTSEEPDSAFLRLAHDAEPLLSPSERSYVVLKTRERNALSAPIGVWLESGDPRGDVPLHDEDRIIVPRHVPLVSVQGEVRLPGYVPFQKGKDVEEYVSAAGGYTSHAYRSRKRITLAATGRQVGAGEIHDLQAGDTVWVPTKPERNAWGTVRDIFGTAAVAASVVLAVEAVTN
jgi:polysaccharide export outer membrane protein